MSKHLMGYFCSVLFIIIQRFLVFMIGTVQNFLYCDTKQKFRSWHHFLTQSFPILVWILGYMLWYWNVVYLLLSKYVILFYSLFILVYHDLLVVEWSKWNNVRFFTVGTVCYWTFIESIWKDTYQRLWLWINILLWYMFPHVSNI